MLVGKSKNAILEELALSNEKLRRSIEELQLANVELEVAKDTLQAKNKELAVLIEIESKKRLTQSEELLRTKLFESEGPTQLFFEGATFGLNMSRMDGTWVESNQAFYNMIGYTREEAACLTYWKLTPRKYDESKKEQLEALATKGHYGPYEKEFIRKDGTLVPVRLNGFIVKKNGEQFIWSIIEDLSKIRNLDHELKQNVKRLEEQAIILNAVLEGIPTAIFLKDATDQFKVKFWNKAAEEIFEVPRNTILEKTAHDLWPKDQADLYLAVDQKVAHEGILVDIPEEPSQSKSRGTIYLHTKKMPLKLPNSSNVQYLLCICNDVTATKEKDDDLRAAYHQLETIADNMPGFISRCDLNGRYTFANKIYEKWLGLSKEQIIGHTHQEIVPPETYTRIEPLLKRAMKGERFSYESSLVTKSGENLNVLVTHVPDYDSSGVMCGYYNFVLDITQVKQTQRKLIESSKMSSLGEMAGGIAHEINNPLAIIYGKVATIRRLVQKGNYNEEKMNDGLSKIEFTVERIAKIIKGLRSFSRNADNDPMTLTRMSSIVEDTLELCRERFKNHAIELRVNCDQDIQIECRPSQIAQILLNLLGNAHDAVEKLSEKWVQLDVAMAENSIEITVRDSGFGISQEIADKIMDPFFSTKDIGKGTGLGLSISKGIAEDHQGHLSYKPSSKNTVFVLELPLKQWVKLPPVATGKDIA